MVSLPLTCLSAAATQLCQFSSATCAPTVCCVIKGQGMAAPSLTWHVLLCLGAAMLVCFVSLLLLGPTQQALTYALCGHAGVVVPDACPPASGSLSSV